MGSPKSGAPASAPGASGPRAPAGCGSRAGERGGHAGGLSLGEAPSTGESLGTLDTGEPRGLRLNWSASTVNVVGATCCVRSQDAARGVLDEAPVELPDMRHHEAQRRQGGEIVDEAPMLATWIKKRYAAYSERWS